MRPIFIALDFKNRTEVWNFLAEFPELDGLAVKVGMELFYMEGPDFVRELISRGLCVFLDLKLYDIPHTVEQAMSQLGRLGVSYVTVHGSGGAEMLQAAKRGLVKGSQELGVVRPKLLAITQLTSTSEHQLKSEQLINATMAESVVHLARLAYENGADGVIAAAVQDELIHQATSSAFLTINPGIRLENDAQDDQKRVVTPSQAVSLGSDGIVVGRSITSSTNPVATYQLIKQEWKRK